ncbi:MAG: hypothetical protein M1832_003382 [Thelocarpon impressellum]|nr:MAG: hypothetical protein M1832_003382 [Thelocarpon impressellum]
MLIRLSAFLPLLAVLPAVQGQRWRKAFLPLVTDDGYTSIGGTGDFQCGVGPVAPPEKSQNATTLRTCLDRYGHKINGVWPGVNCGDKGFYIGRYAYLNHQDCYRSCKPCIEKAIDGGHVGARCLHIAKWSRDATGHVFDIGSMCWMGYH